MPERGPGVMIAATGGDFVKTGSSPHFETTLRNPGARVLSNL